MPVTIPPSTADISGMRGLDIVGVRLILSYKHGGKTYPCVLIHWFFKINKDPDINTGM